MQQSVDENDFKFHEEIEVDGIEYILVYFGEDEKASKNRSSRNLLSLIYKTKKITMECACVQSVKYPNPRDEFYRINGSVENL